MNKGVIIGIVVVVAVVVALPFVAKMGKSDDQGETEAAPAAQPAPQPTPAAPKPAAPAPAPVPAAGPPLDAQSLVGTAWEYEGYRLELESNGQAKVFLPGMAPGPNVQGIPAQWSVAGTKFTVTALGNTIEGQISGNQIVSSEGAITRVK